ncbi:helix-turn-helix domain-containing protein [Oxalobacter aliiformigenes]|nr:Cro/CI family transcriptional regulator [Oxalobacter aliiformigenes]WAV98671.1 helix-turn-helix domain-containing protein [Oxalobacter aliiformigenes]
MKELIKEAVSHFGSQAAFARAVGVTRSAVKQWLTGESFPTPENCVAIEQCTNKRVCRKRMHPHDYIKIWPELAETHNGEFTHDSTANHANRFAR